MTSVVVNSRCFYKARFPCQQGLLAGSEGATLKQIIRTAKIMEHIFAAHMHLNAKHQWNIIYEEMTAE